jgi:hypothetical protein
MKKFGILALALTMFIGAAAIATAKGASTDTTKKTFKKRRPQKRRSPRPRQSRQAKPRSRSRKS